MLLLAAGHATGTLDLARVYDKFPEILSALNAFSLALCVGLWAKGHAAPSSSDSGTTGSLLYDFYWGMELYPRIGSAFDIKTWTNCRMGMMGWTSLCWAFAAAQGRDVGRVTDSMWVTAILINVYLFKFFWYEVMKWGGMDVWGCGAAVSRPERGRSASARDAIPTQPIQPPLLPPASRWEPGYWASMDIAHDRAGYYICWGCLVWVPSVYAGMALYLGGHPRDLGTPLAAACLAAGLAAIWINYDADRQRQARMGWGWVGGRRGRAGRSGAAPTVPTAGAQAPLAWRFCRCFGRRAARPWCGASPPSSSGPLTPLPRASGAPPSCSRQAGGASPATSTTSPKSRLPPCGRPLWGVRPWPGFTSSSSRSGRNAGGRGVQEGAAGAASVTGGVAVPPARHADRRRPPTRIPLPLLLSAAAVRPRLSRRRPLRRQVRGRLGQVGRKRGQTGRSRGVCGLVGLGKEVRFSSLCICLHPRPHPHATLLTSSLDPDSNPNRPNLCGRYRALVPAKIVPGVF